MSKLIEENQLELDLKFTNVSLNYAYILRCYAALEDKTCVRAFVKNYQSTFRILINQLNNSQFDTFSHWFFRKVSVYSF